jgi:hypothetical protein
MPDRIPENIVAPDASAIPVHKGKAIKKTTMADGRSCFKLNGEVCPI